MEKSARPLRGEVLDVNDTHVVQRVGETSVFYPRADFDVLPKVGDLASIAYDVRERRGTVTEITPALDPAARERAAVAEMVGAVETHEVARDWNEPHRHSGKIVAETEQHVLQHVGRGAGVLYAKEDLDKVPAVGSTVSIAFNNGAGVVSGPERGRETRVER